MFPNRQPFPCRPVLVVIEGREGVTAGQIAINGEITLECGADLLFRPTPQGETRFVQTLRPGTYTTQQIRDLA
jgi:hypothetical protein